MTKENLAFLVGGLAFGVLFGFGLFHAVANRPEEQPPATGEAAGPDAPSGPPAPTQMAAAPMLQEIQGLKRALESDPRDLSALTRLANLYHDVGMWTQAAGYYERAIEVKSDDPDLLTDLGTCYRELRQFDRALAQFERAHRADASHWQSLYNRVVVEAFDLGRADEAVATLRRLEEINPRAPHLPELRDAVERVRAGRGRQG